MNIQSRGSLVERIIQWTFKKVYKCDFKVYNLAQIQRDKCGTALFFLWSKGTALIGNGKKQLLLDIFILMKSNPGFLVYTFGKPATLLLFACSQPLIRQLDNQRKAIILMRKEMGSEIFTPLFDIHAPFFSIFQC